MGRAHVRRKVPETFLSCLSAFLAVVVQSLVLVSAFVMVSTVWSVSCLLFFYSRWPVPLWNRRHCEAVVCISSLRIRYLSSFRVLLLKCFYLQQHSLAFRCRLIPNAATKQRNSKVASVILLHICGPIAHVTCSYARICCCDGHPTIMMHDIRFGRVV